MGGMHGFGPVAVPGSEAVYHEPWEPRTFAMSTLIGIEGLGRGAGGRSGRRWLRAVSPGAYYERWLWTSEQRLLRKGTIAADEVDGWVERLRG